MHDVRTSANSQKFFSRKAKVGMYGGKAQLSTGPPAEVVKGAKRYSRSKREWIARGRLVVGKPKNDTNNLFGRAFSNHNPLSRRLTDVQSINQ